MANYGLKDENRIQNIEGIRIYPIDYFCPMSFETGKIEKTDNPVSIHYFDESWGSEEARKATKERWEFYKKYGEDVYVVDMYKKIKFLEKNLEKNDVRILSIKRLCKIAIKKMLSLLFGCFFYSCFVVTLDNG